MAGQQRTHSDALTRRGAALRWIPAAILATSMLASTPADAATADPGRSVASVQAPLLAPGIWGTAPLYGELRPNGAFTLRAPGSAVATGNRLYDAILHQTLGPAITLVGESPRVVRTNGRNKTLLVRASVFVAGRSAVVPLTVRTVQSGSGTWLRAYCRVGLDAYGIRSITGGSAGPLRVAINAFFPAR